MTQDELKALVARAALAHVPSGAIIGVGSGSTVNCFIDALAESRLAIAGAVSSSSGSTARLAGHGIRVFEAAEVESLPVYVDGADEIDGSGCMIKGGGAALTREKIVADLSARFVCIADASKQVERLGRFPLPVEVIPMAAAQITRRFAPRQAGLFVCTALGSRGIAVSVLGARIVADAIVGAPSSVEADLLDAVDPARFAVRAFRRGTRPLVETT